MRSMTARTLTDTGHCSMQPGLGHSMQRSDSWRACSAGKPRFTSWKLCARTQGSCSGTRWRGSLVRSLFGSGLWLGFFSFTSLMGHPYRLNGALGLPRVTANFPDFGLRISLQALDALALLLAIHVVTLHQHIEVDAPRIELGPIDASKFALAIDQHAAAAAHSGAIDHDRVQADDGLDV